MHRRTHILTHIHCAGGAGEACAELRRVNVAQAARIAQLEAELRACKRGAPLPLARATWCALHAGLSTPHLVRVARSMLHAELTAECCNTS
jgi:hypothetical protein